MRILALDLGMSTGWATYDKIIHHGTMDFKGSRYEGGGMRFIRFERWLLEILQGEDWTVYFEEVRRHKGTDAAHVYGGFLSSLEARCEAIGVPYEGIPVGTIKRHATGKGNASKDMMIEAAVRIVGLESPGLPPLTHDEADAICLLDWAMNENQLLLDLPRDKT